jgi:hypothetical protein
MDHLVELVLHRRDHGGVGVTEAEIERRRRAVQVAVSVGIVQIDAFTPLHLLRADGIIEVIGDGLGIHHFPLGQTRKHMPVHVSVWSKNCAGEIWSLKSLAPCGM